MTRQMAYYHANREKCLARSRAYYQKNRAKVLARIRANYQRNPEPHKARTRKAYFADPQRAMDRTNNGPNRRLVRQRFYERNRAKCLAWSKSWAERNKDKVRVMKQRWALKRKLAGIEPVRLDWRCYEGCGRTTKDVSGVCRSCRTTTCRKCGQTMVAEFMGQRLHKKCMPRTSLPDEFISYQNTGVHHG